MSETLRVRWTALLLLAGLAAAYLWWVQPLVARPLLADEIGFAQQAGWRFFRIPLPPLHQPPLYYDLLEVCSGLFHWRFGELRWIGVGCFLLQLLLVYAIAQRLCPQAGPLAAVLWTTHPMAVQGSLIIDIDNTVLAVVLSAWCWLFLHLRWPWRLRDSLALGVVMALGLWAKASTPLGLPALVVCYGFTRRSLRASAIAAWWMTCWCVVVFGLAWGAYQWLRPDQPHNAILVENVHGLLYGLRGSSARSWGQEMVLRLPRLLVWMNPALVALGIVVWRTTRRSPSAPASDQRDALWWYVGALGLGYWLVRGPHFGFAKYHYPMLPVLIALVSAGCVAAGFPTTRRHWQWLLLASVVTGLAYGLMVGDIFLLLGRLRTALVVAPEETSTLVRTLAWRLAGGGCLALAVWGAVCWWRRTSPQAPRVLVTLLVLTLGVGGATDVMQRTTAHSTTYTYGRSLTDMHMMIRWLREQDTGTPRRFWLAPADLLLPAQLQPYPMATPWWTDAQVLAHALADPRVQGLIVSPNTHTSWMYRHIVPDPNVQQVLHQQFQPALRLGEYTMWVRRPTASRP